MVIILTIEIYISIFRENIYKVLVINKL